MLRWAAVEGLSRIGTQEALEAMLPALEDPEDSVVVAPGPVTVQLQSYDAELRRLVVLESREVTAIQGELVEVVFDWQKMR